MNRDKSSPLGLYTIGIAALFLLGFLLLVVFGAQVYSDAVTGQDDNNRTRALRSYLVTCTQSASAEDVSVRDGAEGSVLTIRDQGTDYGLQIFLSGGTLMERYGRLDAQPDPEDAQPIAETAVFDIEQVEDGVYAVDTDAGRTLLRAGSAGGTDAQGGGDSR